MISFVIPTLNEEQVLKDTIVSLRKLKAVPYEIIVSDGHSSDGTLDIAKKLADKVVEHDGKTRQTISGGRNAGAAAAKGELLVFFDADCHILSDQDAFFAEAVKQFDNNPKLVGLTVNIRIDADKETAADKIIYSVLNFNLAFRNNIFHSGESTGEFQMIRKSAFDQIGGFDEKLVTREDADMFYRLAKIGRTMVDRKLTVYHPGRRAHKVGWPKLIWIWTQNKIWVWLFNRAKSKEWEVIR